MNQEEQKNEINLIDYIDIILKRKKLILGLGLLFAILALGITLLISLMSPTIYKTSSILEIGQGTADLSCGDISEKIIKGYYRETLKEKGANYFLLSTNGKMIDPDKEIDTKTLCSGNIFYLKTRSDNPKEAEKFLEEINNLILQKAQTSLEMENKYRQERLILIRNRLFLADNERRELEGKIAILEPKAYQDPASFQLSLSDTKIKFEEKRQEVNGLREQILGMEKETEYINLNPTKIVKPPSSSKVIIDRKMLNNSIMPGVLGLFIGLILAFVKEGYKRKRLGGL